MTKEERVKYQLVLREHRLMHRAILKIMNIYSNAPGLANPKPTTKLVYSMYRTAVTAATYVAQR